ncbi:hypothetical protein TJA_20280 [Thermus sp. LT1-2-5]|uniref:RNA-guided endonuclease InsQ/TnpB family protein n=1 Tax=Thermus sp. LT1-2-5 TaxID=3026935 RepID=UPI0030E9B33A
MDEETIVQIQVRQYKRHRAYRMVFNGKEVLRRRIERFGGPERWEPVVHEDLNVQGLARSYTAKGVLDAGWAQFLRILAYKAAEAGRRVIGVDPKHTSQDCPVCGPREKRPLWVREFTCSGCGTPLHRDVAAARNILARAWAGPSGMDTVSTVT